MRLNHIYIVLPQYFPSNPLPPVGFEPTRRIATAHLKCAPLDHSGIVVNSLAGNRTRIAWMKTRYTNRCTTREKSLGNRNRTSDPRSFINIYNPLLFQLSYTEINEKFIIISRTASTRDRTEDLSINSRTL